MYILLSHIGQYTKAFSILSSDGIEPIKRNDFVETATSCELVPNGSNTDISNLFPQLGGNKNDEIIQALFLASRESEVSVPKQKDFIDTVLSKEQEISAFKRNRRAKLRKGILFI